MTKKSQKENIESEFKRLNKKINIKLFVLIGIVWSFSPFYEKSQLKTNSIDVTLILCLGLGILYLIVATVKGKNRICEKYNLVCSHCGQTPKAFFAVSTIRSGKCRNCGGELSTQPYNEADVQGDVLEI